MKNRKIIQITSVVVGMEIYLIALCDDGTIWRKKALYDQEQWQRIEFKE